MRTIEREIVSALIFSKDGKFFQGFRDPNSGGIYADCWHLPGGGIEPDETLADGARREAFEETGIDVSGVEAQLIDDMGRGESVKTDKATGEQVLHKMKFNIFTFTLPQNAEDIKVNLSDEFVDYRWTDPVDIKGIKLTPPSVELFTRLGYL